MSEAIAREVKDFVVNNFLFGHDPGTLTDEQSFLENGIIDSTGVLELVGIPRAALLDFGWGSGAPARKPRFDSERVPVRVPEARSPRSPGCSLTTCFAMRASAPPGAGACLRRAAPDVRRASCRSRSASPTAWSNWV